MRRHGLAALTILLPVVYVYADVLRALVRQWATDNDYSHGFFVLPLALFFAWERRRRLRDAVSRPSAAGLALVGASVLLLVAGRLGAEVFLMRISLIGVLAGAVLFVWGREHLRILAFPLAFLLLMVPLPAILFNQVAFPLQLLASRVGESVIVAAGVPVLREGNVLHLPHTSLEVAEACSGIRSLTSLVMLGVVLGYFTEPRSGVRLAIAAAAVPIAIVANASRVAGTGLASQWMGPGAAEGFFHTFSGWLMFVVAFAGLVLVQQVLSRLPRLHASRRSAIVEAS